MGLQPATTTRVKGPGAKSFSPIKKFYDPMTGIHDTVAREKSKAVNFTTDMGYLTQAAPSRIHQTRIRIGTAI